MAKRKAEIARLVSEGLTDTEIAAALGITRNAAIGSRHRMGLAGNNRLRPNGEPRARPVRKPKATEASPTPIAPAPVIEAPKPKKAASEPIQTAKKPTFWHPVLDLREHSCKWPNGTPGEPDFHYCCDARRDDNGPYCKFHSEMAYAPRHGRAA